MDTIEKKCFKCFKILPLSDFYKHKSMGDGHLNKCKTCTKVDTKIRTKKLLNDTTWIVNEKKRHREKYHRLGYKKKYKPTSENKKDIMLRYRQKFPEKAMALRYTEIYIRKKDGVHFHHWSYNQKDWLDVIELPIKEHYFIHRYIKYDSERMMYRNLDGILLDTKERHLEYFNECKEKYKD